MTTRGAATTSHLVFAAIVLLIVATMAVASSTSESASQAPATTPATAPTSFASTVAQSGLQLRIKVNATSIQQGGVVAAQIDLINMLSTNVTLGANFAANPNLAAWNKDNSVCDGSSVDHIFDYAVYQGHITAANISAAGLPLLLQPPDSGTSCINYLHPEDYVTTVEFPANSDVATLSANASESSVFKPTQVKMLTDASTEACAPTPDSVTGYSIDENGTYLGYSGKSFGLGCSPGSVLYGYWPIRTMGVCPSAPGQVAIDICIGGLNYVFQPFPAGSYTIVAEDMWNDSAYAYFHATPEPSPVDVISATCTVSDDICGPALNFAIKNIGNMTITSLSASFESATPFTFEVNESSPIFPFQTLHENAAPAGVAFDEGATYALAISGTLVNGSEFSQFSYVEHVLISAILGEPVGVNSVTGPIPSNYPDLFYVSVSLRNIGETPITSLNAYLPTTLGTATRTIPYSLAFDVSSSSPLLPGQNIQDNQTLIEGPINTNQEYPLTIYGSLPSGLEFSYTMMIQIAASG
jgi:hypothetical protein